jgi:hypothetical protein
VTCEHTYGIVETFFLLLTICFSCRHRKNNITLGRTWEFAGCGLSSLGGSKLFVRNDCHGRKQSKFQSTCKLIWLHTQCQSRYYHHHYDHKSNTSLLFDWEHYERDATANTILPHSVRYDFGEPTCCLPLALFDSSANLQNTSVDSTKSNRCFRNQIQRQRQQKKRQSISLCTNWCAASHELLGRGPAVWLLTHDISDECFIKIILHGTRLLNKSISNDYFAAVTPAAASVTNTSILQPRILLPLLLKYKMTTEAHTFTYIIYYVTTTTVPRHISKRHLHSPFPGTRLEPTHD